MHLIKILISILKPNLQLCLSAYQLLWIVKYANQLSKLFAFQKSGYLTNNVFLLSMLTNSRGSETKSMNAKWRALLTVRLWNLEDRQYHDELQNITSKNRTAGRHILKKKRREKVPIERIDFRRILKKKRKRKVPREKIDFHHILKKKRKRKGTKRKNNSSVPLQ